MTLTTSYNYLNEMNWCSNNKCLTCFLKIRGAIKKQKIKLWIQVELSLVQTNLMLMAKMQKCLPPELWINQVITGIILHTLQIFMV